MSNLDCISDQDLRAFLLGQLSERVADTIKRRDAGIRDTLSQACSDRHSE